jgi:hypothetical protein
MSSGIVARVGTFASVERVAISFHFITLTPPVLRNRGSCYEMKRVVTSCYETKRVASSKWSRADTCNGRNIRAIRDLDIHEDDPLNEAQFGPTPMLHDLLASEGPKPCGLVATAAGAQLSVR